MGAGLFGVGIQIPTLCLFALQPARANHTVGFLVLLSNTYAANLYAF